MTRFASRITARDISWTCGPDTELAECNAFAKGDGASSPSLTNAN